ncbi:hypothetical protein T4A_396 [Trichinella pseudospiralis]|uniref:Uncharacterized protein n=1 Tax=Trichinella pseudospiralis TaxID=6337 RepID=A0A0V1DU12_TRIPS|nr:hypothetical protein T4A_396 [Trichinella pseudospiralis]
MDVKMRLSAEKRFLQTSWYVTTLQWCTEISGEPAVMKQAWRHPPLAVNGEPKVHVPITFNFCLDLNGWRKCVLVTYHEFVFYATAANSIRIRSTTQNTTQKSCFEQTVGRSCCNGRTWNLLLLFNNE